MLISMDVSNSEIPSATGPPSTQSPRALSGSHAVLKSIATPYARRAYQCGLIRAVRLHGRVGRKSAHLRHRLVVGGRVVDDFAGYSQLRGHVHPARCDQLDGGLALDGDLRSVLIVTGSPALNLNARPRKVNTLTEQAIDLSFPSARFRGRLAG